MGKKPRPLERHRAWEVVWESITRTWTRVAVFAAILTSSVSAAAAWSSWGLPIPATRDWVTVYVSDIRMIMRANRVDTIQLQLQGLQTERTRLEDQRTNLTVKLRDPGNTPDTNLLIQDRLITLSRDLKRLDARKNKLLSECRALSRCDVLDFED